jgi:hypothetical protein
VIAEAWHWFQINAGWIVVLGAAVVAAQGIVHVFYQPKGRWGKAGAVTFAFLVCAATIYFAWVQERQNDVERATNQRLAAFVQEHFDQEHSEDAANEEMRKARYVDVRGGSTFKVRWQDNTVLRVTAAPDGIATRVYLPERPRQGQWVSVSNGVKVVTLGEFIKPHPMLWSTIYVNGNGKPFAGLGAPQLRLKGDRTFRYDGNRWRAEELP